MARRKKKPIRSDPETVKRMLAELRARETALAKHTPVYRTRRYVEGPSANPGHPAQGGLPSLGKGY